MIIQDDRTEQQKATHDCLVVGTDDGLSGWGLAEGGKSYAAWACTGEDLPAVEAWVRARGDMKRVRVVYGKYSPRGRAGHLHVYVAGPHATGKPRA